jgi:tRNA (guanine37-N1)-methyltransferase
MQFDIVTIFPQMFDAVTRWGVSGRAVESGLVSVRLWNPRDFAEDNYRRVDDRPYGGGPGMVMMAEPLRCALDAARTAAGEQRPPVLHLSPQGRRLDHAAVLEMARRPQLILLCGRYEGIDDRLLQAEVDEEWSIGDYVLSGGELAAMVLIDAVTRQLPGVVGNADSIEDESFAKGLLDCGHFTRPPDFMGRKVPEVLLSGDHERIRRWRLKQALGRTWLRRPDLLETLELNSEQRALLDEFQREHDRHQEQQS